MNATLEGLHRLVLTMTRGTDMFDARTLSRLERAFDLQMWAFGCDARRAEGHLFAVRGMERRAPAAGSGCSSTWSETIASGVVEVSSLGVRLGRAEHHLFLQRGALAPQLRGASPVLWGALVSWVLEYEDWVDVHAGRAWRPSTLASRQRPAPFDVDQLREVWRSSRQELDHERTSNL